MKAQQNTESAAVAYSYLRFSSPQQAEGDAVRRQSPRGNLSQTLMLCGIPVAASVSYRLRVRFRSAIVRSISPKRC